MTLNNLFKNRGVILGVIIFIFVIIAATVIYFDFFPNLDSLHPSFETFVKKIPFLHGKILESEDKQALDMLRQALDEEKEKIRSEWKMIEDQKRDLEDRMNDLEKKEQALEDLARELTGLKADLESSLIELKDIAQYYELMESSKAAEILNGLEDEFITNLLKNMKKEPASRILERLDPQKAASVTKTMSGIK